jgi:hypothetical protein
MSSEPHKSTQGAQGRLASLIIALTGVLWIAATWAGGHWEWPQRTRALIDLLALAGFVFALIVTFRIWRQRQKDEG